ARQRARNPGRVRRFPMSALRQTFRTDKPIAKTVQYSRHLPELSVADASARQRSGLRRRSRKPPGKILANARFAFQGTGGLEPIDGCPRAFPSLRRNASTGCDPLSDRHGQQRSSKANRDRSTPRRIYRCKKYADTLLK